MTDPLTTITDVTDGLTGYSAARAVQVLRRFSRSEPCGVLCQATIAGRKIRALAGQVREVGRA